MACRLSVVCDRRVFSVLFALLALFYFIKTPTLTRMGVNNVVEINWTVNYQTWAPDCVEMNIISINGQFPGPTVRATEGDTIVVHLANLMPTENVVIHWHGIRQIGTPWEDGTASTSQCAIYSGESYQYRFVVDRPGTYFYHGHYGLQRSEGIYGSLIVDAKGKEPFAYDDELSILIDNTWHKTPNELVRGLASIPFVWVEEPDVRVYHSF